MADHRTLAAVAALALVPAACTGSASTGTPGSRGPSCVPTGSRALLPDEPTALGSPRQRFEAVLGKRDVRLRYYAGERTPEVDAALELEPELGTARWIERDCSGGGGDGGPLLEISATLRFTTSDGAFDERFPGLLRFEGARPASFVGAIPTSELGGDYPLAELDREVELKAWRDPEIRIDTAVERTDREPIAGGLSFIGQDADTDRDPTTMLALPAPHSVAEWPVSNP